MTATRGWNALVAAGTALFGFGLSFSTAAVSIGMSLLAIALVLRPRALLDAKPWHIAVMAIGLVLLAYIAMRTIWPVVDADSWRRLNQYQELLLAPALVAVWQSSSHRRLLFASFIAGCVVVAIAFWVTLPLDTIRVHVQTHRISSGFALAVAAYLLVVRSPQGARKWPALACAAFLSFTVLFAIDGRTGQVVLVLLAACAAWIRVPRRWRLASTVAAPLALIAAAMLSPVVQGRIVEMKAAFERTTPPDESDSTGVRIQLLRITAEAVRENWLAGVGYANYGDAHEKAAHAIYDGRPNAQGFLRGFWATIDNPHDEYALQLVGGGVPGLLLFVAWLAAALVHARRAPAPIGTSLAGVTLAFAVGCAVNSLLLDYMEGHLYVGLLAWLLAERRFAPSPDAIGRIAIVATRQIGDVLLTTPLIHAARERWPQARIDVIGFAGTLGTLRGNPDVAGLVEMPARGGWSMLPRLARRYDLALVTDVGDRAHLIAWAAAPVRSGIVPERNASNWWKRMLLEHAVVAAGDRGDRHVVVEKLELLAPWGASGTAPQVRAPQAANLPADVQARLDAGFVVVHAPSMWPYKQWPVAHFGAVVRALTAQGRQVVLTGSDSARDRECIEPLRGLAGVLDVSGRLDFNQLTALLGQAALYIGPDTSVSHLAAATGVPVIAIFGPTNPLRWAPWPATGAKVVFARRSLVQQAGNVTLLQSGLECVPCGRAGCEDHRQSRSDCLQDITPERVIAEASRILTRS